MQADPSGQFQRRFLSDFCLALRICIGFIHDRRVSSVDKSPFLILLTAIGGRPIKTIELFLFAWRADEANALVQGAIR